MHACKHQMLRTLSLLWFACLLANCGADRPPSHPPKVFAPVSASSATAAPTPASYQAAIEPYVAFLRRPQRSAIDYLVDLFDRYDLVVLCERWHPEMTQYALLADLINDPRFSSKVSTIFTEIGTSSLNGYVASFMNAPDLSDAQVNKRVLEIYRDIGWETLWLKTNWGVFLKNLYRFNRSQTAHRKIRLVLSDMPFDWSGMTREKYQVFRANLNSRDRVMADQILERWQSLERSDEARKKALVIMNYRHAFRAMKFRNGGKGDNTGRYLFEALPGRVANVMLNSVTNCPSSDEGKELVCPIQQGKWDAAFAVADNPQIGFDFSGTPFGKDDFDYFPYRQHDMRYQDVFTGFVFYQPLSAHKLVFGVPGLTKDGFSKELFRRLDVIGQPQDPAKAKARLQRIETIKELRYEDTGEVDLSQGTLAEQVARWLKKDGG